jgi:ABC-2 type transport system ATP-binding protein
MCSYPFHRTDERIGDGLASTPVCRALRAWAPSFRAHGLDRSILGGGSHADGGLLIASFDTATGASFDGHYCEPVNGLLEIEGLTRRFGTLLALDDLSFSVPAGQVVGFLGPNGAGKTTTMRAVFGLTDLDAGVVRWDGMPVGQADRRRFGYMPEERGLYPGMLVGEQLEYLGRLHGMTAADAREATATWLERLGVADRIQSKVEALSHGNQQRVQLAAALVHDPEMLVLDEPLAGLDPTGIDAIGGVLAEQARSGCCVLFSSHQLDQVEDLCESVTIIDHGRLVVTGRVDDLATSGSRRLVVRVEGDRDAVWARGVGGVTISQVEGGEARLVLDETVDSDAVLQAAMRAGRVTEFAFKRRSLSEVFREALQ